MAARVCEKLTGNDTRPAAKHAQTEPSVSFKGWHKLSHAIHETEFVRQTTAQVASVVSLLAYASSGHPRVCMGNEVLLSRGGALSTGATN